MKFSAHDHEDYVNEDIEWAIKILREGGISEGYGGTHVDYTTLRSNIQRILAMDRKKQKRRKNE